MSDTRDAVARALAALSNEEPGLAEPQEWIDPAEWNEDADAAIAAYEANPPDWLVYVLQHSTVLSSVPEHVRRAAGL